MKVGMIGCGNMGGALAEAAAKSIGGSEILIADQSASRLSAMSEKFGMLIGSNRDVAATCKYIFLGVKPQAMASMLADIRPVLQERSDRFILVTMAAGMTMAQISELVGGDFPMIRIMPNMPVSVGEGMILYTPNPAVTPEEVEEFMRILAYAGTLDDLPEQLIDAGSAVSGCGPAFVSLFLEAMADGGVSCGLPRAKAQQYAAQTLIGTAKAILQTGLHPGQLKDAVCSPGGSTIAGVQALEEGALRGDVLRAVIAAWRRTQELGK